MTDVESLYNMYKKYMNTARECGSGQGCFGPSKYKWLNGTLRNSWEISGLNRTLVLADGVRVMFYGSVYNDCSTNWEGADNICGAIAVDVNGEKKPNTSGRDIFYFVLKEDRLMPRGCDGDNDYQRDCHKSNSGFGCACKVLREGAMNY